MKIKEAIFSDFAKTKNKPASEISLPGRIFACTSSCCSSEGECIGPLFSALFPLQAEKIIFFSYFAPEIRQKYENWTCHECVALAMVCLKMWMQLFQLDRVWPFDFMCVVYLYTPKTVSLTFSLKVIRKSWLSLFPLSKTLSLSLSVSLELSLSLYISQSLSIPLFLSPSLSLSLSLALRSLSLSSQSLSLTLCLSMSPSSFLPSSSLPPSSSHDLAERRKTKTHLHRQREKDREKGQSNQPLGERLTQDKKKRTQKNGITLPPPKPERRKTRKNHSRRRASPPPKEEMMSRDREKESDSLMDTGSLRKNKTTKTIGTHSKQYKIESTNLTLFSANSYIHIFRQTIAHATDLLRVQFSHVCRIFVVFRGEIWTSITFFCLQWTDGQSTPPRRTSGCACTYLSKYRNFKGRFVFRLYEIKTFDCYMFGPRIFKNTNSNRKHSAERMHSAEKLILNSNL